MKILVSPHKCEIVKTPVNEKEINVTKVEFEFSEEITDDYVKDVYFTLGDKSYQVTGIQDNECDIPYEVLKEKGQVEIGVVAYLLEDDEYVKRYNPSPVYVSTLVGSLKDKYENYEEVTPSDKEQMEQALQEMEVKIDNLDIDAEKTGTTTTITITHKDGTQEEVEILDGEKGDKGDKGDKGEQGIQGPQGETGPQGEQGVAGPQGEAFTIKKTYSSVAEMNADFNNMNVGDYVMIASSVEVQDNAKLYTRGENAWIFITDFSGATGIQGEQGPQGPQGVQGVQGPQGIQGETGPTGNGIVSITKTSSAGLIDTYTITYTNGNTTTFEVTNGQDGEVTQEYVDEHDDELRTLFNVLPKVSGSGESVTLNDTGDTMIYSMDLKGNTSQEVISGEVGLEVNDTSIYVDDVDTTKENYITLEGNTEQNGIPTIDSPVNVDVVTGNNTINVEGKNLFDKDNANVLNAYISLGNSKITYSNGDNCVYIPIKNNTTYTITKTLSNRFVVGCTDVLPATAIVCNPISTSQSSNTTYTITSGNDSKYLVIYCYTTSDTLTLQEILDSIQIEQSSTATTYEAYQGASYQVNLGNIELCKIGTYQDRIYKSLVDGNWYVHKEIGKVVLDGSEDWDNYSGSGGTTVFFFENSSFHIGSANDNPILSSHFKPQFANNNGNIYLGSTNNRIAICTDLANQIANWKTWLSSNNVTCYYALATPTDTQITDATLVNQLEALYTASIHTITHINTDTSNLLPYIDLKYNVVTSAPSPNRASEVKVVTGNNTITISNEDGTKTQTFNVNLGSLEFCKIGNYQDYIYYDKSVDKWYKYGAIGKVVLNGSENWDKSGASTSSTNVFYTTLSPTGVENNALSNMFIYSTATQNNAFDFANYGTNIRVKVSASLYPETSDFKTWLGNNQPQVYYVLATPTTTEITNSTLIAQLDELKKAMSYYDKTLITQTNANKPFILDVVGIRDLQDIFDLISGE